MKKLLEYRIVKNTDEEGEIPGVLFLQKTEEGYKAGNYIIEDPDNAGLDYLEKVYNRVLGEPLEIAKTKHITLRELTAKDANGLYEIYNKPGVSRFYEGQIPEIDALEDMLKDYRFTYEFFDCGMWGIFENTFGRLIGECGVKYTSLEGKDCYELGFALDDDYTGRGLAFEAASASLEYCFANTAAAEVFARVRKNNHRSVRLLKKLGFTRAGSPVDPLNPIATYKITKEKFMEKNKKEEPLEIEKKYLIKEMPNLSEFRSHEIEQAYLNRNPVLRIRKRDEDYIFTYKSSKKSDKRLQVSTEIEEELTKEAYLHLREKADGFPITKTRYIIPLKDGLKGELDVFHGRLEGLIFIEVEFKSVEDAGNFTPPEWFGKDVTEDKRYRNGYLSTLEKYENFD
jgi:RimJ/RimL family protein N-acetyltransferase/CYTH domain-containing protein